MELALSGKTGLDAETIGHDKILSEQLNRYLAEKPDSQANSSSAEPQQEREQACADEPHVENEHWHISLRFGADVLRNGMDPLSFIRYLETIGDIVNN